MRGCSGQLICSCACERKVHARNSPLMPSIQHNISPRLLMPRSSARARTHTMYIVGVLVGISFSSPLLCALCFFFCCLWYLLTTNARQQRDARYNTTCRCGVFPNIASSAAAAVAVVDDDDDERVRMHGQIFDISFSVCWAAVCSIQRWCWFRVCRFVLYRLAKKCVFFLGWGREARKQRYCHNMFFPFFIYVGKHSDTQAT